MISKIIGISGNMGAGKTTLAHALQQDLKSTLLRWDDFDDISTGPSD
jgi:uridine kinase